MWTIQKSWSQVQRYQRLLRNQLRVARIQLGLKAHRYQPHMELATNNIGLMGACDVFSKYALEAANQEEIASDDELANFITFYAANYRLSKSQWSQDIFVLFKSQDKTSGTYLEIGGADGVTHSNTLMLNQHYQWTGALVEPDPYQFQYLKLNRSSGDQVFQAAIAPDPKQSNVQFVRNGQLSSVLGYHDRDMHATSRLDAVERNDLISVSTMDINELLKSFDELDYFSLDVEGCEVEILSQIDWENTTKPRLFTIEHAFEQEAMVATTKLLLEQGYRGVFSDYAWLTRGDLWFELID